MRKVVAKRLRAAARRISKPTEWEWDNRIHAVRCVGYRATYQRMKQQYKESRKRKEK